MPIECYKDLLKQADDEEWSRGRRWYHEVNQTIGQWSKEFKVSKEICAGVIAVLSPMVEWSLNLKSAYRFIKTKGKVRGPGFDRNYDKAKQVLKGNLEIIRGPKVKRFYETILNPSFEEAVIDTQMIAAFYSGHAYRDDFKIMQGNEKRLEPIRKAVSELADEYGESVSTIQATIWLTFKRLNGEYANQLKLFK